MPSRSLQSHSEDRQGTEDTTKQYIIECVKVLSAMEISKHAKEGLGMQGSGFRGQFSQGLTETWRWQENLEEVRKLANMKSGGRAHWEERPARAKLEWE